MKLIFPFSQIIPNEMEGIIFLAAFMGWMPHPWIFLWQSIWTKEKLKIDNNINYKTSVLILMLVT